MADNTLLLGPRAANDPYSAWHNIQSLFGQGPYSQAGLARAEAARPKGPEGRRPSISDLYSETGGQSDRLGGLTTRTVSTYGVDSNGNPILPADRNKNDVIKSVPAPSLNTASTIDAANPIDVKNLGLTTNPFDTPATRAIARQAGYSKVDPETKLSYGMLLDFIDPTYQPTVRDPGRIVAGPSRVIDDPWGSSTRTAPAGPGRQGLVTGTPRGYAPEAAPAPTSSPIEQLFGSGFGGHDTSSPEAFAASVTRPSTVPGVSAFTGTVQQGQGGQNRFGSTARNELLALYG